MRFIHFNKNKSSNFSWSSDLKNAQLELLEQERKEVLAKTENGLKKAGTGAAVLGGSLGGALANGINAGVNGYIGSTEWAERNPVLSAVLGGGIPAVLAGVSEIGGVNSQLPTSQKIGLPIAKALIAGGTGAISNLIAQKNSKGKKDRGKLKALLTHGTVGGILGAPIGVALVQPKKDAIVKLATEKLKNDINEAYDGQRELINSRYS